MVSNLTKMAWLTRHLFFFSLLLVTNNIYGQNISKHYTSSTQEKGTLYFIFPQSGFKNSKIKSELIYDLTYTTNKDSITLNFSYFDNLERNLDSIAFISDSQRISSTVKNLFIESEKSKWHYRYSSKFLFTDIDLLFNQDEPKVLLYTKEGPIHLQIKTRVWRKHSLISRRILTLIKRNQ